jgi:hypothetical protein
MTHDDQAWRALLCDETPEPDDAGFSLRVMGALPAQRRRPARHARHADAGPARAAELLALGSACAALGLLALQGPGGLEQSLAAVSLLGLVLWWSMPQSAGSQWR